MGSPAYRPIGKTRRWGPDFRRGPRLRELRDDTAVASHSRTVSALGLWRKPTTERKPVIGASPTFHDAPAARRVSWQMARRETASREA